MLRQHRYNLVGNESKGVDLRPLISFFTLVAILFGCLGFGYALTVYFAEPAQNARINNLDSKLNQVMTNLTNETTARNDKDMTLMYNISVLSMDIDYLYSILNMTNSSGVFIVGNLIYLNQSVTNLTGDVNNIYSILNQSNNTLIYLNQSVTNINNQISNIYGLLNFTNSSITSLVTDVNILNNSVAILLNNVSALEAKTLLAGTGITILNQNSNSYGTIHLSNISGVSGMHSYPSSVTVDGQGRITSISAGVAPIVNITVGPGLSINQMNPAIAGGTLTPTNNYIQLQSINSPSGGMATYATVFYDQYGRVNFASSGISPVLSINAGIGMNFTTINGTNSAGTINLADIPAVSGAWCNPELTVDGQGRITAIMNGTMAGSGTVTSITAGAGLEGGTITTNGTISMPTIPGNGTFTYPTSVTTDAQGRVTNITTGLPPITSVTNGTGLESVTNMGSVTLSLPNVGTPNSYVNPLSITTDAQGRVTNIINGTTPISSISAGTGISFATINSTNPSGSISLADVPNVSGAWSNPELTVDGQGRITAIMNGTMAGSGTVTSITVGAGLNSTTNPITTTGTISLPNVGTSNTYAYPTSVTTDAQGRVTNITTGLPPITSVTNGTGLESVTNMGSVTISLPNVGTPNSYVNPSSVTTDAQGRVTNIINGTTPISSISAGTGMSFATINSTNPSGTISLSNIANVSGSWTNPSLIVDGQGRITLISNGTMSGSGTVTSITAGAGLTATPSTITTSGMISMGPIGPVSTTYKIYPTQINVDAQGRVVSATEENGIFFRLWPDAGLPDLFTNKIRFTISLDPLSFDCQQTLASCIQGFTHVGGNSDTFIVDNGNSGLYQFMYNVYSLELNPSDAMNGFAIQYNRASPAATYYIGYSFCTRASTQVGGTTNICSASATTIMYMNAGDTFSFISLISGRFIIFPLGTDPLFDSGFNDVGLGDSLYSQFQVFRIR